MRCMPRSLFPSRATYARADGTEIDFLALGLSPRSVVSGRLVAMEGEVVWGGIAEFLLDGEHFVEAFQK